MATLDSLLAAIEKDNKSRYSTSRRKTPLYTGRKHTSVVNPKTSKGSTKDGGGGILGDVLGIGKNLAKDVEDTVTGLPGGVIQTIHDPVGTVKAVGKDYARRYSPLVHGDFGKFAKEIAAHPLAPLLDAATVATGGGALAAKVGQAAKVAETIDAARAAQMTAKTATARKAVETLTKKKAKVQIDRTAAEARMKAAKAPDVQASSAKAFEKHTNTIAKIQDEIGRQSKTVVEATPGKLPAHIEALVKLQRITKGGYRHISADSSSTYKGIKVAQANNPVKRLRQNLGIGLQESRILPDRTPIVGLAQRAKKAANLQRDVEASRIRYAQRRVIDADKEMTKLAGKDSSLHSSMAIATQALIDGVAPRDYARLMRDTRSTGDEIQHSISQGLTQAEHHALTEKLARPHMEKRANELYDAARQYAQREALQAGRVINPIHLQHDFKSPLINSPEVEAIVKLQRASADAATDAMNHLVKNGMIKADVAGEQAVLHTNLVRAAKGQTERSFEDTAKAYEKAGLPVPAYNPDTLLVEDAGRREGMLTKSEGTLYKRGTKVYSPMNIVMRHELASKATDLVSAHKLMLSAAQHLPPGSSLPKGFVWVKDTLAKDVDQKEAMFRQQVEDGMPLGHDYFALLESQKRPEGGYAIRKSVADDLAAGRRAMSAARGDVLTKAITAWKYLVLTRPAFLVHNVLSNQAMYFLKNGWNFAAFRNMRAAFKSGLFKEHHAAEGVTFGEDVMGLVKKKQSKASKALHIFYKLTAQHEHWLRELTAYETIRKMPEFKREMRALKGGKFDSSTVGGRTVFHEAYNRAVKKNPHIRDLVTRNMDDTLGNYRYYTQQEQLIKNISPFYGWERHSVRNMVRMMEDNPATMAMLTQIGIVGHKKFNKDFGPGMPDFVKSYVQDSYIKTLAQHLGLGNEVSMYDFNSTNPWTTAVDVGKAVGGDKAAFLQNMGPAVTGPMEALTGKSVLTGAPTQSRFDKYGPIAGGLDRVITSTPPITLWDALTSQKNEKKKMVKSTDRQVGAQQVGFDFRNLDKKRAREYEKRRTAPKDKYGRPIKQKS